MGIQHHEYFGTEAQQALQARSANLWTLLNDDPRFSCHGRAVTLAEYTDDNLAQHIALARLQGACPLEGAHRDAAARRTAEIEAAGLKTDAYVNWQGGPGALGAARSVLAARNLADDLAVTEIGPDSPAEDLQKMDRLTQSCGVLLPMGSFVRGLQRPSVFLCAMDPEGRAVGAAAAVAQFHPDHAKSGISWWGMLATDDSRRGEGIALILGAMSLIAMHEKHGFERFLTGIREGNAPSEALCTKLGLAATDGIDLIAIDPAAFGEGRLTK